VKREPAKRASGSQPRNLSSQGKLDIQESPVADDTVKSTGPFDVRTVKALVALMTQHDLSEIDLRDGNQRLRLRRGAQFVAAANPGPLLAPAPSTPAPTANNQEPKVPASPARKLIDIKSQTVGTFYSAPNPGAEAFVKVGSRVTPASVVGLIEAMKLFNEIPAECSGVVVEILVENQQPVEFGQVLMRVDPTA
jgi:acetyl-CoA carboxylase biotin carboxyl carrier protein